MAFVQIHEIPGMTREQYEQGLNETTGDDDGNPTTYDNIGYRD